MQEHLLLPGVAILGLPGNQPMSSIPIAYVFTCGADVFGFSVEVDGSNLPALTNGQRWIPLGIALNSPSEFAEFTADPRTALINLRARGYHFARRAGVERATSVVAHA